MNERADSPTCTCQVLLFWFSFHYLVGTTFSWYYFNILQNNDIEKEIFVQPPSEIMEKKKIWKLQRCIHGLDYAPRE